MLFANSVLGREMIVDGDVVLNYVYFFECAGFLWVGHVHMESIVGAKCGSIRC